jgi:hypothetical protein
MMIVTKFLRSCCGQATVGENSSKAGDDIGGIESRAHQTPAERFRVEEARTVADEMTHEGARTIMRRIAMDYDSLAKLAEEQLADQEAIGRKT